MKIFSYIIVAVISFVVSFVIVTAADFGADSYDFSDNYTLALEEQESTPYTTYYDQLSDSQKMIYNVLKKTVSTAEEKVVFSNININQFKKDVETVAEALQYDCPEYFWYTGGYSYETSRLQFHDEGEVTFEPTYYDYVSAFFNASSKLEELEEAVADVAKLAKEHSSDDYERIIFVHDYLIKNAIYDHDALEEYYKVSRSPSCEYIFSSYGCLVNGKTVCSGYAKAFQLIMRELGYDCTYVTGEAGERHGWNCVYLNGEGYFVDITWDDADFDSEIPLYDHAFITSDALSRTHTIDMPFETPVCTATDYNYFIRKGYYLEEYDYAAAVEILLKQKDNAAVYIQFGSNEELGEAVADLYQAGKILKIDGFENTSYFGYNESQHTMTIY